MSDSSDCDDKECPLCMETLELDDINFYPCKCEYQICRFCWHRIRENENGLCPACRQQYPDDPVNFKALTPAEVQRMKQEKKQKAAAEKLRIVESRKDLHDLRVLQKNLIYVVGLSGKVADAELLKRHEYFGKYGKIVKVAVGTTTSLGTGVTHTAYVTYSRVEEALRAIQGVNNVVLDGRMVKASLGTTKYCAAYIRGQQCYKMECMYLHEMADTSISFTKEDMQSGKHGEYERRLMDTLLSKPTPTASAPSAPSIISITPTTAAAPPPPQPLLQHIVSAVPPPPTIASTIQYKVSNGKKVAAMASVSRGTPPPQPLLSKELEMPVERKNGEKHADPRSLTPLTDKKNTLINGKTKVDSKDKASSSRGTTATKLRKELKPSSSIPVPMQLPPDFSASPPDDWTSRDDAGPSGAEDTPSTPPALPSSVDRDVSLAASDTDTDPTPELESRASPTPPQQHNLAVTRPDALPPSQSPPSLLSHALPSTTMAYMSKADDDFGFDPFHESLKGLDELVEEERRQQQGHPQDSLSSLFANFGRPTASSQTQRCAPPSRPMENTFDSADLFDNPANYQCSGWGSTSLADALTASLSLLPAPLARQTHQSENRDCAPPPGLGWKERVAPPPGYGGDLSSYPSRQLISSHHPHSSQQHEQSSADPLASLLGPHTSQPFPSTNTHQHHQQQQHQQHQHQQHQLFLQSQYRAHVAAERSRLLASHLTSAQEDLRAARGESATAEYYKQLQQLYQNQSSNPSALHNSYTQNNTGYGSSLHRVAPPPHQQPSEEYVRPPPGFGYPDALPARTATAAAPPKPSMSARSFVPPPPGFGQHSCESFSSGVAPPPGFGGDSRGKEGGGICLPAMSASAQSSTSGQATASQSMMEWQEGLRALLPNVNIRFANNLD